MALALLLVVVEHFRGKWALNRRLSELRARGEVLSVAALEPKRPAVDQNATPALMGPSNRLATVMSDLDKPPPTLRFASPGRVVVAWQLQEWSRDGKATNDWSSVADELSRSEELLNEVHAAVAKPFYDSDFNYRKGLVNFQMAPIGTVRRAAQFLTAATVRELSRAQLDAADRHLCALVKLAAEQRPEPLLISQLVRHACAAFAFNATWQALQAKGWTDYQLTALQSAWAERDFTKEMAAAMEMERALSLDFYEQQMALTAIAIHRYRLRTGHPPADLATLIPDYLPAMPQDRMHAKPLRYRVKPNGDFVLYSVREDGKDDGGDPSPLPGKENYRRIFDGRDAVWPIAATPEEAAAPMNDPRVLELRNML